MVGNHCHTYTPTSSFLILKSNLPRLAVHVEVESKSSDEEDDAWEQDYGRIMAQGASLVRFANSHLNAYKKEKDFVFVIISISIYHVEVRRHLLFQEKDSRAVCRHGLYVIEILC
jgi:hypothetical protein